MSLSFRNFFDGLPKCQQIENCQISFEYCQRQSKVSVTRLVALYFRSCGFGIRKCGIRKSLSMNTKKNRLYTTRLKNIMCEYRSKFYSLHTVDDINLQNSALTSDSNLFVFFDILSSQSSPLSILLY